jgi:hypothetical protein
VLGDDDDDYVLNCGCFFQVSIDSTIDGGIGECGGSK